MFQLDWDLLRCWPILLLYKFRCFVGWFDFTWFLTLRLIWIWYEFKESWALFLVLIDDKVFINQKLLEVSGLLSGHIDKHLLLPNLSCLCFNLSRHFTWMFGISVRIILEWLLWPRFIGSEIDNWLYDFLPCVRKSTQAPLIKFFRWVSSLSV